MILIEFGFVENLIKYFKKIFIIDTHKQENKSQAFQNIINLEKCLPQKILSVGNRLSDEIAHAKQLGMKTCHIKVCEHQNEQATTPFEVSDWTIKSLHHLIKECQL